MIIQVERNKKKTDRPPPCWCCSLLRRRHSTPHKKRNERKAGNKKKRPTGVLCIDSVSLPVSLDLRSITLHSTPSLKASLKSTRCHKKLKTKIIPPQAEASLCVNYSSARSLLHSTEQRIDGGGPSEREVRGPSWLKLFWRIFVRFLALEAIVSLPYVTLSSHVGFTEK